MNFDSNIFVFCFLPVFLVGYYVIPSGFQNVALLLASVVFYVWGSGQGVVVLLAMAGINQIVGLYIARCKGVVTKRILLCFGILGNLLALSYFRYRSFLLGQVLLPLMPTLKISSWMATDTDYPLGISFITFTAIAYLIEVYHLKVLPTSNPVSFALYLSMFPKVIAGPIVRYSEIQQKLGRRLLEGNMIALGICRFTMGLGKKVLIADTLGGTVDSIWGLPAAETSSIIAWVGAFCYSFQIYFDFSGYTDMAIGLGTMLGFRFPENFNQPYRSTSITEFWRRWHMTMSRWFRDFLYIPLGGNQKGAFRTYMNLCIVFFLCGLWHGPSWTFVCWGLYHGAFLVLERILKQFLGFTLHGFTGTVYTFVAVSIGWVFFRAESISQATEYLRIMFSIHSSMQSFLYFPLCYFLSNGAALALFFAGLFSWYPLETMKLHKWSHSGFAIVALLVTSLIVLVLSIIWMSTATFSPFIYFRF